MSPTLDIFTTSYNEPETVATLIDWYRKRVPHCNIVVLDNESDDNGQTRQICANNSVRFETFSTGGVMDESALIYLRNNAWKGSKADFVIVCDSDELVDVNIDVLKQSESGAWWNLCQCQGVELFGRINEDLGKFYGTKSEGYSKSVLFHRPSVVDMNFAPGSHTCGPTMKDGVAPMWISGRVNLFHTKWQDWGSGLDRQHAIRDKGLAESNKRNGWNFHYSLPDSAHEEYFNAGYAKRILYDTL